MKLQLVKDDMEIYQLIKICGGYKCDTQKMNRMVLDKIQSSKILPPMELQRKVVKA